MIRLGVNIDHVATLRQARGTVYPEPLYAALIVEETGADGLTIHLREDRRHIQDRDVVLIKEKLNIPLNLEMALTAEMLDFACEVKPAYCCLVPEKREELTTEGGLNVVKNLSEIASAQDRLSQQGITISLFIDPDKDQIQAAKDAGVSTIELHTGAYADAETSEQRQQELVRIQAAAKYAHDIGLIVNAGHGLHYHNVQDIVAIPNINELNIGHSIIVRAVFTGLKQAVLDMKVLLQG